MTALLDRIQSRRPQPVQITERGAVVPAHDGWSMRLTTVATLRHPEGVEMAVRVTQPTLTKRFGSELYNGAWTPTGSDSAA